MGEEHHSERVRRLYRAELPFQHLPRKSSALIDFKFSPKEGTFCAFYTLHKQAKLCITLFDYIPTERKNFRKWRRTLKTKVRQFEENFHFEDVLKTNLENFNC